MASFCSLLVPRIFTILVVWIFCGAQEVLSAFSSVSANLQALRLRTLQVRLRLAQVLGVGIRLWISTRAHFVQKFGELVLRRFHQRRISLFCGSPFDPRPVVQCETPTIQSLGKRHPVGWSLQHSQSPRFSKISHSTLDFRPVGCLSRSVAVLCQMPSAY